MFFFWEVKDEKLSSSVQDSSFSLCHRVPAKVRLDKLFYLWHRWRPAALKRATDATHLGLLLPFVWLHPLPWNTSPQPVKRSPDGHLISLSFSPSTLLSSPLMFPLSALPPLAASPALTHNLNSLRPLSPPPSRCLSSVALFLPKMDAVPLGVVSGEQGKEEALTVEPALVPSHWRCSKDNR